MEGFTASWRLCLLVWPGDTFSQSYPLPERRFHLQMGKLRLRDGGLPRVYADSALRVVTGVMMPCTSRVTWMPQEGQKPQTGWGRTVL